MLKIQSYPKFILLLFIFIIITSCAGNSGYSTSYKTTTTATESENAIAVFKETLVFDLLENEKISWINHYNDNMFICYREHKDNVQVSTGEYVTYDIKFEKLTSLLADNRKKIFCTDDDSNIYILNEYNENNILTYKNRYLYCYNSAGDLIRKVEIEDRKLSETGHYVSLMVRDMKIYIISSDNIQIIDMEGKTITEVERNTIVSADIDEEGNIIIVCLTIGLGGSYIEKLNKNNGDSIWKYTYSLKGTDGNISYSEENSSIYLCQDMIIQQYNKNGEYIRDLFNLRDYDIAFKLANGFRVEQIIYYSQDIIYVHISNNSTGKEYVYVYERLKGVEAQEKLKEIQEAKKNNTQITFVMPFKNPEIDDYITLYKAANRNIDIIENIYSDGPSIDYASYISTYIMSGMEWDMISLVSIPYNDYINKGVFANLYEIETSKILKNTELYYQNIISACEINNHLYYLPTMVSFDILFVDEKLLSAGDYNSYNPDMNWEQFVSFSNYFLDSGKRIYNESLPGQAALSSGMIKEVIDYENRKLNTQKMDYYLSMYKQISQNIYINYDTKVNNRIYSILRFDKILQSYANTLNSLQGTTGTAYFPYSIPMWNDSKERFFSVNEGFAINKSSNNQKETFNFILFMADNSRNLSPSKTALETNLAKVKGNKSITSITEGFKRCIENLTTKVPFMDNEIRKCIHEETIKYKDNLVSKNDAIKAIEDKVWLFLNE